MNTDSLGDLYWRLTSVGLGQWVSGFYVAAAALFFVPSLDYSIRTLWGTILREDAIAHAIRILEYFHDGLTGELRDPYLEEL